MAEEPETVSEPIVEAGEERATPPDKPDIKAIMKEKYDEAFAESERAFEDDVKFEDVDREKVDEVKPLIAEYLYLTYERQRVSNSLEKLNSSKNSDSNSTEEEMASEKSGEIIFLEKYLEKLDKRIDGILLYNENNIRSYDDATQKRALDELSPVRKRKAEAKIDALKKLQTIDGSKRGISRILSMPTMKFRKNKIDRLSRVVGRYEGHTKLNISSKVAIYLKIRKIKYNTAFEVGEQLHSEIYDMHMNKESEAINAYVNEGADFKPTFNQVIRSGATAIYHGMLKKGCAFLQGTSRLNAGLAERIRKMVRGNDSDSHTR